MSKFHQYIEFSDQIVARWQKISIGAVAGSRVDPYDPSKRVTFLLKSAEDDFDLEKKTLTFNYENDVIELYSDLEARMFPAINKAIMEQGLLAPYHGTAIGTDMSNVFSEAEIQQIIVLKKPEFIARLNELSSWATVARIAAQLRPTDAKWKHDAIQERMCQLTP